MPGDWDGRERRRGIGEDHDLLIEIARDLKHLVAWSRDHEIMDAARFLEANKEIAFLRKIAYGVIGVVVFVEFVIKFVK